MKKSMNVEDQIKMKRIKKSYEHFKHSNVSHHGSLTHSSMDYASMPVNMKHKLARDSSKENSWNKIQIHTDINSSMA